MREKGRVIVQCGGGSCLINWLGGDSFLEHGAWALIQRNTEVDHRVRLKDADNPTVSAIKSLFTRFFLFF